MKSNHLIIPKRCMNPFLDILIKTRSKSEPGQTQKNVSMIFFHVQDPKSYSNYVYTQGTSKFFPQSCDI